MNGTIVDLFSLIWLKQQSTVIKVRNLLNNNFANFFGIAFALCRNSFIVFDSSGNNIQEQRSTIKKRKTNS